MQLGTKNGLIDMIDNDNGLGGGVGEVIIAIMGARSSSRPRGIVWGLYRLLYVLWCQARLYGRIRRTWMKHTTLGLTGDG